MRRSINSLNYSQAASSAFERRLMLAHAADRADAAIFDSFYERAATGAAYVLLGFCFVASVAMFLVAL